VPTELVWRNKRWRGFSAGEPRESPAYVKLNSQMPCPPRGTVPDNQGRGLTGVISTQRAQFAFGHGCDPARYVARKISATPFTRKQKFIRVAPLGWNCNYFSRMNSRACQRQKAVRGNNFPSTSINFAYDALNQLTNLVDGVGTHNFSYTATGQLQSESDAWATVSFTYTQGQRTALNVGSWSQSYGYDSGWRMTSVSSPAGGFSYAFGTSASSLLKKISLPNGAYITNSFDSLARQTGTALNNYWGHTLDGYTYGLDALGLKTNLTRDFGLTSSSVKVGYDNIQQLIAWNASETNGTPRLNEQLGWAYDAANNLLRRTNNALVQTFAVDAADELTNVTRAGTFTLSGATPAPATSVTVNGNAAQTYGDFTFAGTNVALANGNNTFTNVAQNTYGLAVTNTFTVNLPASVTLANDSNGSLTNDGVKVLSYDAENQLTNVMVVGQWKSDFVYDGLNRRRITRDFVWQSAAWVKTNETRLIYDGYLPLQERDTNNNVLVTYTRGLDMSGSLQGAGGIGGLLARTDANGSTFYHADGNENVTALMDGGENIVARYLYNPFGKLIGKWGPLADANAMRFSSMPELRPGIVGFALRPLLTDLQRFANNDPIQEAGGFNLYRLARNNPLNFVDPWGLSPFGPGREMLTGGGGGGASAITAAR
jgi:RHS repeat-associated protein